jgi:hypothetical protein
MVTMQRGDRDGLATGFGNDDMRRSTPRERPGWPVVVAGTIAVAVVLGPPLLLLRYREARMAKVSTPEARAVWDAFRAEMSRQSGDTGPVKHKVPKSAEPPELVWLRDYTPLAIGAWMLLSGVLAAAVVWFIWGASCGSARRWGDPSDGGDSASAGAGPCGDATVSGRELPGP